ncbi:MAG: sugar transferase [Gemmatimonadales bacterium]
MPTNPLTSLRGRFGLGVSVRQRLLAIGDLLLLNIGLLAGLHFCRGLPLGPETVTGHLAWFLSYSAIWTIIALAGDNYHGGRSAQPVTSLAGVAKAFVVTELIYLAIPILTPPLPSARILLAGEMALRAAPLLVWRVLFAAIFTRVAFRRRAIIVGAGQAGRTVAEVLDAEEPAYLVAGFVDDDETKAAASIGGLPVLGRPADLARLTDQLGATDIILAITHAISSETVDQLLRCYERGARIVPMPHLYEQVTGRIPVEHIGDRWLVSLPLDREPSPVYLVAKRLIDVVVSVIGIVVLAPFMPLIALAIKLDSPGPLFYRPERLGQGGRPFRLWKLRTMVADADRRGDPTFTSQGDSRITRIGRLLRGAHIDELPQFMNVLVGQMSLVGPRPERYVPELEAQIPFYRMRLAVKPGTAGWALVKQGYAEGAEGTLVKLQYDLYYIKNQSLYLDFVIMIRTAVDMLFRRGR